MSPTADKIFVFGKQRKMPITQRYVKEIHTDPSNSYNHEHITWVRWNIKDDSRLVQDSKAEMIRWLNQGSEHQAFVSVGSNTVPVIVVNPPAPRSPFLRTIKDGTPSDNLLSLPRF